MASKQNIALSVKNVTKDFYLPHEKQNSIKAAVVNIFKRRDKEADTQHALRNISFDIKEGEFFGILGRNGSGKSTILKIISEIYQPTSGTVTHVGKLVPFIELGVGFNPELTGRENVYLNGALLGFSEKEIDERYNDIVNFSELSDFMDQRLKNYSSGMQVRLAFAVATHAEADILVVDEVLAVGDADFQRKCYQYFKSLKKQKKTVIFVSHDMSAVREFCDRAILIESSRVVAEDSADKISSKYSRLFIEQDEELEAVAPQTDNRWGNGSMMFRNVTITSPKTLTDTNGPLKFTAQFISNKDVDTIITGSSVTNSAGEEVCGTNTLHQRIKLENIKKGELMTAYWEYPNIFSDGSYTINVTLHGSGNESIADWWQSAATFNARREEKSPFVVTPDIKLVIKHDNKKVVEE